MGSPFFVTSPSHTRPQRQQGRFQPVVWEDALEHLEPVFRERNSPPDDFPDPLDQKCRPAVKVSSVLISDKATFLS